MPAKGKSFTLANLLPYSLDKIPQFVDVLIDDLAMKIKINEHRREVPDNTNLLDLFNSMELVNQEGVAVAINNEITARSEWNKRQIKENDQILIIKATNGG